MSIPDHAGTNFQTLLHAAAAGDLVLVECADAAHRRDALRHLRG